MSQQHRPRFLATEARVTAQGDDDDGEPSKQKSPSDPREDEEYDPFLRFGKASSETPRPVDRKNPAVVATESSTAARNRRSSSVALLVDALGGGSGSAAGAAMRRKASMLTPGEFVGNDFDNEARVLEVPKHRGATSATSFLRLISERAMERLRESWGSRKLDVEQFVKVVEPVLVESAAGFFDESGKQISEAWMVEGWVSSAQRSALLLKQAHSSTSSSSSNGLANRRDSGGGGSDDATSHRAGSMTGESRIGLSSSFRRRGSSSVAKSSADALPDAAPPPPLTRLASTLSIRNFLREHSTMSDDDNNGPKSMPTTAGSDNRGGSSDALESSVVLSRSASFQHSPTRAARRRSSLNRPLPGSTSVDATLERDMVLYLRNLYAHVDFRRTNQLTWDSFSTFLVHGITGVPFRSDEENDTTKRGSRASGASSSSPIAGDGDGGQAIAASSSSSDDDDDDDASSENGGGGGSDEEGAVMNYRVVSEVSLPGYTSAGGGGGGAATIAASRKDWVQHMQYYDAVDKILVVMKRSMTFLDPLELEGGGDCQGNSGKHKDGGDNDDDDDDEQHRRRLQGKKSSGKLGGGKAQLDDQQHASQQSQGVIGTPTASCLPLHVLQTSTRISTGLFLPHPFWGALACVTDRGVASLMVWQYQVAPQRSPEVLLATKLYADCNESSLITCSLYTKPPTEAERLGLASALVVFECVIWLGTRNGEIMTVTLTKDVSNASKPQYAILGAPRVVGSHCDVVTTLLFMQHTSAVATASLDGSVHIFDYRSRVRRATLHYHKLGVTSLAYSRDQLTLFTAGHDGAVAAYSENLWSSPSYVLKDHNKPPEGPIVAVRLIPQTNFVATFDTSGTIRFFDSRDRRVIRELSALDPQLFLKGILKREDLRRDVEEGSIYVTAAFGTSGTVSHKHTTGGYFSTMVYTGAVHRQFVFAGSHAYIAVTSEHHKRNPLCTYDSHHPIVFASMSRYFGLVSASDREVSLWSLKDGMRDTRHRDVVASPIHKVALRPASDWIVLGLENGDIVVVQLSTANVLQRYQCHDQTICGLSLHPRRAQLVSTCRGVDGLLCFWEDDPLLLPDSDPVVQSGASAVHPVQVIPLLNSPFTSLLDPTGTMVVIAYATRLTLFAQHAKFLRWVEMRTIHHGRSTEINAVSWLDTSMYQNPNQPCFFSENRGDALGQQHHQHQHQQRYLLLVGDHRGYLVLWEIRVGWSADDVSQASSHQLLHLGNNVSTADRFFASRCQKVKKLALAAERQKALHGRSGGADDTNNSSAFPQLVGEGFRDVVHDALVIAADVPPPRRANRSTKTTEFDEAEKRRRRESQLLPPDLADVEVDPTDTEMVALVARRRQQHLEELQASKDSASQSARKKLTARHAMDTLLRGTNLPVGEQMDRELEMIRVEATYREARRRDEEALLALCSGEVDATNAGGGGAVAESSFLAASATSTPPPTNSTVETQQQQQQPHRDSTQRSSIKADHYAALAAKRRRDRQRRLTKHGLFSYAALQQMEIARNSPTLSTMDPQLAIALEKQQHERTQAIKHFHVGLLQAISGEDLLAPSILCTSADAIYPFLVYTGDTAGRVVVWYMGSADPFLVEHVPQASSSWLKELQPLARFNPHGADVPVLHVESTATPFHSIVSWGGDNTVVMSSWSGVEFGRFQQGPIVNRRWHLASSLRRFNDRSFTVQLLWMKLRRFVVEGYFMAHRSLARSTEKAEAARSRLASQVQPTQLGWSDAAGGVVGRPSGDGSVAAEQSLASAERNSTGASKSSSVFFADHLWSRMGSVDDDGGRRVSNSDSGATLPSLPPSGATSQNLSTPFSFAQQEGRGGRSTSLATPEDKTLGAVMFGGVTTSSSGGAQHMRQSSRPSDAAGTTHHRSVTIRSPTSAALGHALRSPASTVALAVPLDATTPPLNATATIDVDPHSTGAVVVPRQLNRLRVKLPGVGKPPPLNPSQRPTVDPFKADRGGGGGGVRAPSSSSPLLASGVGRTGSLLPTSDAPPYIEETVQRAWKKILARPELRQQLSPLRAHTEVAVPTAEREGLGSGDDEVGSSSSSSTASTSPPEGDNPLLHQRDTAPALPPQLAALPTGRLDDDTATDLIPVAQWTPPRPRSPRRVDNGVDPLAMLTRKVLRQTPTPKALGGGASDASAADAVAVGVCLVSSQAKRRRITRGPRAGGGRSPNKGMQRQNQEQPQSAMSLGESAPALQATAILTTSGPTGNSIAAQGTRDHQDGDGGGVRLATLPPVNPAAAAAARRHVSSGSVDESRLLGDATVGPIRSPMARISVRAQAAAAKQLQKMQRAMATTPQPGHASDDGRIDLQPGDDEDEVERAFREAREKRRCVSMLSHVEVNKRRHEQMHTTQAVMRCTLAEIDKARRARAMGPTPYYSRTALEHTPACLLDESSQGRIVFSRRAIISEVPTTTSTMTTTTTAKKTRTAGGK